MAVRLADRLSVLRRQCFVGREPERALFRAAVTASELPFHVLHVCGPGGIGKSTLLRELLAVCAQEGIGARYLDARDLDASPACFAAAVAAAFDEAGAAPVAGPAPARRVLLVDTYEALAPLDAWLRERFLPDQPADTLTVLAGREPPQPGWRCDPGWQALVRTLHLRNLPPDDGRRYLARRGVPEARHDAALAFTHGHPLALSLVADHLAQRPDAELRADEAPDIVRELLGAFASALPSPAHRATLEACAVVRGLTEGLLADLLALPEVHALFEWLRGLSFVDAGPNGLVPHDLARDALLADLRWRDPDRHAALHRRARAHCQSRLRQTRGAEQQAALVDWLHLHRDDPVVGPCFAWRDTGGNLLADALRPADVPALVAMTARHEGDDSARLAAGWLARAPGAARVLRDGGEPAGWLLALPLAELAPDDVAADPATAAAWRHVEERAPLRDGERATLFRFWMARDAYQDVSPAQSLAFVTAVQHHLGAPDLALTLFACAAPERWAPLCGYADLARAPGADFDVGGRRYGVYAHDWRATPPAAWLARLGARARDATASPAVAGHVPSPDAIAGAPAAAPVAVFAEPEFAAAVHDALRGFASPRALRRNPLLRSRVVAARAGAGAPEARRAQALQGALRAAAAELRAIPRDARLYDVLHHAYFHPAPSQERAADVLRVSFSTFRRHLKLAVDRVAERLWAWELDPSGGVTPAAWRDAGVAG